MFIVRVVRQLPRGPCGLSSGAGGRWGSPMAHGPWGSLSLVFAALSVCGALGGSCDRSLCSSVADDCCAPLSIGEAATCRNGYVAQRTVVQGSVVPGSVVQGSAVQESAERGVHLGPFALSKKNDHSPSPRQMVLPASVYRIYLL